MSVEGVIITIMAAVIDDVDFNSIRFVAEHNERHCGRHPSTAQPKIINSEVIQILEYTKNNSSVDSHNLMTKLRPALGSVQSSAI